MICMIFEKKEEKNKKPIDRGGDSFFVYGVLTPHIHHLIHYLKCDLFFLGKYPIVTKSLPVYDSVYDRN